MDKGAYEIIKMLIQCTEQKINIELRDGTTRTLYIDPEKLITELDKDQKLEKEANWLAERLEVFCESTGCMDCIYVDDRADICQLAEHGWREVARKAVEEECQR